MDQHADTGLQETRDREALNRQAASCRYLGSPFTALLCDLLADHLTGDSCFARRILEWPGDPVSDALALRAAGALHALARSGCDALKRAYPPQQAEPDALLAGIAAAIRDHDAFLNDRLDSAPQTN